YSFFRKYFDPYLFYFSQKNLEEKISDILIYKENQKIRAALIYTQTLNANFLDFIAVDRNLKHKNVAFALLNHYFAANTQNKFFKLFVEEKNQKAINFYKRAGFCFNHINLKFYRNF
ncbi:GNAT family N-acetyltransferase, partial [Campylobacter jejuni]|nr:GNAT family N-acetyltransferase [Campylobacter jejuni]